MSFPKVKILWRVTLALVMTIALVFAVLGGRLSQGPIPLSFLDRRIEQALDDLSADLVARVERTDLVWAELRPGIRVLGVSVQRRDGSPVASLPMLSVRLSLRALLWGRLAIAQIGLSGVRLALVRTAEGSLTLGGTEAGGAPGAENLLAMLAGAGADSGDMAALRGLHVRDAELAFEDRDSGSTWAVSGADLDVRRRSAGSFSGEMRAALELRSGSVARLRNFALRVVAHADVSVASDGRLDRVSLAIGGEGGRLAFVGDGGAAMTIHSVRAEGLFTAASGKLEVRGVDARIGSVRLGAEADVTPGRSADLRGEVRTLPVAELEQLWPAGLAGETRNWIRRNIRAGVVSRGRFSLRVPLAPDPGAKPAAPLVDVAFDFDGLEIHYLDTLPPARSVRGSATLTAERFAARVEQAAVGQLQVPSARVTIALLEHPVPIAIEAEVEAASGDLLDFLDQPPLNVASWIGIPPTGLGGQSHARATIRFPIVKGMSRGDVRVSATAVLRDTKLAALLDGIGIADGQLDVRVAEDGGIEVNGKTLLTGMPGAQGPLDVRLSFTPGSPGGRLQATLHGADVDGEGVANFDSGVLQSLSATRLKLGRTELAANAVRLPHDGFRVSLAGERFDLERFLELVRSDRDGSNRIGFSYDLDFRFARVFASAGLELADASGSAQGEGGRVRKASAVGSLAQGGKVTLELTPIEGARRLKLTSDRGGETLKTLGLYEGASGGHLALQATIDDAQPQTRVTGELELSDFRVLRAPVLAQILSLGSFGGIAGMLDQEGLPFTRVRVPFVWSDASVEIHDARAVGAIGLTADGTVERASRQIDLRGDIIPADTLNSALGSVPVVGSWIAGGEGAELFGIEYRASGSLEQPEIHVNPLTAFAPGALRKMFGTLFAGSAEPTPKRR